VTFTLAAVERAARIVKRSRTAADKYPVSRRATRRIVATLASVAACAAVPAAAHAGVVTEFTSALTAGNAPASIASGPDGNLWFTEQGILAGVGRITPDGTITEFPTTLLQTPGDITTGPDGGVWFTETGLTNAIARIDPSTGAIVEHTLAGGTNPRAITTGADGNLWFTEVDRSKLGRITPAGDATEYGLGLGGSDTLNDVTTGPDGKLWFTVENSGQHKIGRFNPADEKVNLFSANLTGAPNQITAASDGKLYFTESGNPAAIGRIKTDGKINEYRSGLAADAAPDGIAEGSDGWLWFAGGASPGRIGRFNTTTHAFTEHLGGGGLDLTGDSVPTGIASGPDGNLWFTENAFPGRIGRMALGPVAELALAQKVFIYPLRHEVTDGELQATVTPNSQDTTYHVEYGTDESYGSQTAESAPLNGADPVTEVVDLPLDPSSHYHARVVATNASGEADSADVPLWTDADNRILDFDPSEQEIPEVEPTPTPTPTPTSTATATPATSTPVDSPAATVPVAPPVLGESVNLHPLSGSVRVKAPGARTFHALGAGAQLPVGTTVDTRAGRIVLQSARDARGRTQNGTFWGGVFQIRQRKHGKGMTDLVLRGGGFSRCGAHRASVSVLARDAKKGKRRVVRRLWGKDNHSRFRTHGRDSVATVRGTRWVTTDRCDGTLTRVTQGKVSVRDLHRKRSVLVSAGHAYLARHRHH
jgi:streptogramin lyase